MKKIIFKNFLSETTVFFLLSCTSVALIVWVIQAVNYLGFVTEDGHGFRVYFLYTLLSLPKIFNKLLPFMFFFSIFVMISKYEDQNQILIFWTNGIRKINFLNNLLKFSLIFLVLQLSLNLFVVPLAQDKARSFIRQSNIDFLPSLIKPKKFLDTVEKLTIYIDKKNNEDQFQNIIIKDKYNVTDSKIIYAKEGNFQQVNDENVLILKRGKILNINKGRTTAFDFNKTQINLSQYSSKTTKTPKLQEVQTTLLIKCLFFLRDQRSNFISVTQDVNKFQFQCKNNKKSLDNVSQEFFKRIFKPLYLPLLTIVSCLLLIKSKNSPNYTNFKFKIFGLGILLISISEVSIKFFSHNLNESFFLMMLPIIFFVFLYYLFFKQSMRQPT